MFGSRRLYIESWKIQDFVSFWENFFGVRVGTERGGGEGVGGDRGAAAGHFDIWSRRGHPIVMRRSRSDQSEKRVCPGAQLLPDSWPSRMTVWFAGSQERSHGGGPDSSLMECN